MLESLPSFQQIAYIVLEAHGRHMIVLFHSVAIITPALHTEGPEFMPQWNHRLNHAHVSHFG